jgi:hypothetical protein
MTVMERQILPSGEKAMATGISRTPPMEVIPLSNWEGLNDILVSQ